MASIQGSMFFPNIGFSIVCFKSHKRLYFHYILDLNYMYELKIQIQIELD